MGKGHKSDPTGSRSDTRHSGNDHYCPGVPDHFSSDRTYPDNDKSDDSSDDS
uniref:Uncharacterized protein n=1 Tax=viral metagenome TaxID=1070528 RepID=A0A6M3Y0M1_9ZZZZ